MANADHYVGQMIGRVEHFSIPCSDPEHSVSFYEAVLGAKVFEDEHGPHTFGISESDKALGRPIHIFMQLECGQRIELLKLDTGRTQPAGTHHGFQIGPNDLPAIMAHLDSLGVPFWGPGRHKGTNAVSIYWKDPDNNQFEFVILGGYPDFDNVPLSQHMAKPPIDFRWDAEQRRAISNLAPAEAA
jgi:catechol 2,3-dioxygenase-like lactoylglutathione lyase family enzyme